MVPTEPACREKGQMRQRKERYQVSGGECAKWKRDEEQWPGNKRENGIEFQKKRKLSRQTDGNEPNMKKKEV